MLQWGHTTAWALHVHTMLAGPRPLMGFRAEACLTPCTSTLPCHDATVVFAVWECALSGSGSTPTSVVGQSTAEIG